MQPQDSKKNSTNSFAAHLARFDIAKSFSLFVLYLGLWAVIRICWLIWSVGGNNLSNDYVAVVPLIDRCLLGEINFAELFSKAQVGQHFVVLPTVFHLLSAYFFDWNARAELFLGVFVNLFRSFIISDLLAVSFEKKWKPLVLGVVLAMVFSVTNLSVHLYGQACFPISLSTLGFTLAVWGLVRYKGDWRAPTVMLIGGIGSAASMGNVPACWLAIFLCLILFGYRRAQWLVFVAWLIGAIMSFAPYAVLLFESHAWKTVPHAFSPLFFINLLGRPFSNEIGYNCGRITMAEQAAEIGIFMLALSLIAVFVQKNFSPSVKTSITICAYGLLSVTMLSFVRTLVAPWYGTFASYFWLGLIGLLLSSVLAPRVQETIEIPNTEEQNSSRANFILLSGRLQLRQIPKQKMWSSACLACLLMLPVFYFLSNRSWTDKHAYMNTRSPASESALRHYKNAPTYVESLLFQWGDGKSGLLESFARPLERHLLSSFAPHQIWSLQGDFVLPTVKVRNAIDSAVVKWIEDTAISKTVSWSHYEHSNLYIHTPNAVSWQVTFPDDLRSAKLSSAFTIGRATPQSIGTISDGASGQIYLIAADGTRTLLAQSTCSKPLQWLPLNADLTKFRGQTVTLLFMCNGGRDRSDDLCLFRYPVIEVMLKRRRSFQQAQINTPASVQVPVNTDLDKNFGNDFEHELGLPAVKTFVSQPFVLPTPAGVGRLDGQNKLQFQSSHLAFASPIPLNKYSYFTVVMNAPRAMKKRSLGVQLSLGDGSVKAFSIPLTADAKKHKYSYELKLLELEPNSLANAVILYPVSLQDDSGEQSGIEIQSLSFATAKSEPIFEGLK